MVFTRIALHSFYLVPIGNLGPPAAPPGEASRDQPVEDEEVEEAEEEHSSHFSIKGNAKKIRGKLRSTF